MSVNRLLVFCATIACIAGAPVWAAQASLATHADSPVKFNTSIDAVVKNGQLSGVFTIECQLRPSEKVQNTSWMTECNQLGRIAIDRAVKKGLIEPVKGVPFVKASQLPDAPWVQSMSISRSFPLIDTST